MLYIPFLLFSECVLFVFKDTTFTLFRSHYVTTHAKFLSITKQAGESRCTTVRNAVGKSRNGTACYKMSLMVQDIHERVKWNLLWINIAENNKFQTSVVTFSLTKFFINLSGTLGTGSSSVGALIVGQVWRKRIETYELNCLIVTN